MYIYIYIFTYIYIYIYVYIYIGLYGVNPIIGIYLGSGLAFVIWEGEVRLYPITHTHTYICQDVDPKVLFLV